MILRKKKIEEVDKMSHFSKRYTACRTYTSSRDEENFADIFDVNTQQKYSRSSLADIMLAVRSLRKKLTEFHHTRLLIKWKIFC